ncbi:RES family NAD+ phosphorylase [Streptomyces sp. NEAU-sy36]|uniref:RES family NAD+ phosphorylase n=1 Tax=unclassified Streptomyces TaxID=2593676 RepID=UPI0015D64959|nr:MULTISPECIES: RES family NAD+ phosphorylase [unclassified Streptomyces]QLJ01808.1 RES family NAD+ phosphorylase [Streptomyces sp. NEAU-sy36]
MLTVSPSVYRFRPHWEVLPAGTHLWRMHSSRFAAEEFKPFDPDDPAPGRFHGTPEDPYPCLYAATEPETALAETLLRSVRFDPRTSMRLVPWAAVRGKSLNAVRTRCELKLVSLRSGAALAAVCQDHLLLENEGPEHYRDTRRWAREIRAQAPEAMGMIWDSKRNPPQRSLVLFGDRLADHPDGPLEALPYRSITDLGSPEGVKEVNQLLEPLRSAVREPLRR